MSLEGGVAKARPTSNVEPGHEPAVAMDERIAGDDPAGQSPTGRSGTEIEHAHRPVDRAANGEHGASVDGELARSAVQRRAAGRTRRARSQHGDDREQQHEAFHAGDTRRGPAEVPAAYGPRGGRPSYSRRVGERAWIRGARRGSVEDLEHLFREHWPRAHRAAFLVTGDAAAAEDIAQEAFLSAIRTLHRFDRRRQFAPWLGRIVVNRAIDWTRARAARREVDRDLPDQPAPAELVGGYSDDLLRALATLTPEHRAVVVLRYALEYTPGEIARALELPRGTVNSRLRRALDALDAELREVELT